MATHPMSTAWAKYNWASKHMDAVARAIQKSVDPNAHPVAVDINLEPPHGNIAVARVTKLPRLQTDYGLALGDTIQNFRAALDHLAWCLVKLGNDPRPANPQSVYFPMARSGKSFRGRISEWLPGVPQGYRAIIRRYQPYRSGDRAKSIRWLRNLSNTDKHRILIPAVVSLGQANLSVIANWPMQQMDQLVKGRRALNVGTPLLRVSLFPVLGTQCQVQVQGNIACFPSLGYGAPVGDALTLIRSTVFEILDTFDKLLL
jgi:hypothetical protein